MVFLQRCFPFRTTLFSLNRQSSMLFWCIKLWYKHFKLIESSSQLNLVQSYRTLVPQTIMYSISHQLLKGIFPNHSGQYWWIVEVRQACCIGCTCFRLFTRFLLLISRIFICTLLVSGFSLRIYLTTFLFLVLITTLFLVLKYADNINSSSCSAPFQFFKFHNTTSQLFKFRFVIQQNSHKTHRYFIEIIRCCVRVRTLSGRHSFRIHKYWYNRHRILQFLLDVDS